jgi:NAD(P)-dependent dehydrogenase (short-subunit alcohol dehydrogenase family)
MNRGLRTSQSCEDFVRLPDQVAIVTGGAGSGIGHGISFQLAKAGAHVVIADIDRAAGEAVAQQITADGHSATSFQVDVCNAQVVQDLVNAVLKRFGQIDILVNSAGLGLVKPIDTVTDDEFDKLMDTDVRGVWLCTKYVLPVMTRRKKGSIINISSVHECASLAGYELYAAAKAAVSALTRGIAIQYGTEGIRANSVCPGLVDGQQTREVIGKSTSDVNAWMKDYITCNQTLPTSIQPEDIGNLVVFLASESSRCITGVDIPVDCGTLCLLASKDLQRSQLERPL